MTKQEAIQSMREGNKLTHYYFSPEEWVTIENGKMLFEDGVRCDISEFWKYRTVSGWNTGWSIIDKSQPKPA